jgi:hypothetical protein
MKYLQFTDHRRCWKAYPSTRTYFNSWLFRLKTQVKQSFLHLQHTRHQLSLDGAGLHELDVDSVKSSSDYFPYSCIPSSETTLHQEGMSTTDRSHFRSQTVENNCKNDRVAARRAWIPAVLWGLCFSNCVTFLALDFNTPRCSVVGWGTVLQAGRSRVRSPMRSLDFSIYLILLAALWHWVRLSL